MAFEWSFDTEPRSVAMVHAAGEPSFEEFQEFLDAIHNGLEQMQGRKVYILDVRELRGLTAKHRAAIAEFRKGVKELQKEKAIAFVYLISNPMMRGMLNATMWLMKPPVPLSIFGSLADAKPFVEKHLAGEGLQWPTELAATG